jgi:hypothetical protein
MKFSRAVSTAAAVALGLLLALITASIATAADGPTPPRSTSAFAP